MQAMKCIETPKGEFLGTVHFSSAPNTFCPLSGSFQIDGGVRRVRKDRQTILREFGLDLAVDLGRREKSKLVYFTHVPDKPI